MRQDHDLDPYDQREGGQIDQTYDYDLNNIQYRPMTVDDWSQVPNSQSYYSQYWDNSSSFEPSQFSNNMRAEKTYYDSKYSLLFFVNIFVTITLIVYLSLHFKVETLQDFLDENNFNTSLTTVHADNSKQDIQTVYLKSLRVPLTLSFIIAFGINLIHFIYAHLLSQFYIKFGMLAGLIFSGLYCVATFLTGGFGSILLSGLMLVLSSFWYCLVQSRIPFSSAIFKTTTKLVLENPSIVLLCLIHTIISFAINVGYIFICVCTAAMHFSPFWYVYCVFSYTWITLTITYVIYMTGAGLAASWYFLNGTPNYPKHPIWESFKRSSTTSFGSACLAALIVAVIEALRAFVKLVRQQNRNRNNNDRNNDNAARLILEIVSCLALCILSILESFAQWISHYALIYCSIFGVPYYEGCRRWAELEYTRFINVLIDGCVIRDALNYNMILFVIFSGLISHPISLMFFKSGSTPNILFVTLSVIFTLVGLTLMNDPISTMSDTLLVCFAESPATLKENNNDLYNILCRAYTNQLNARL
ncbi:hypothetical protein M9Y10_008500 [Tritrichomonas musculus]|uniref:Choline transporter-like protein n=1 Tax=Tritrichomonas musculus TaxID=1915356 RepID=A0ABR2IY86_9EUKA